MYHVATSDPVVRTTSIGVPGLAVPLRAILISDIHVAGPDMPPARLQRIVGQINTQRPDLVLIAGDFVSDKKISTHQYSVPEAIAPLSGLSARLGVVAVIGNHDHWRDAGAVRRDAPRRWVDVSVRFGCDMIRRSCRNSLRAEPRQIP